MLIHNATLQDGTLVDLRIEGPSVAAIETHLPPRPGEILLDAGGGVLLPGLHDHHLHLMALATSLESLRCGPPHVSTAQELEHRLVEHAAIPIEPGQDWIRGIGYHESVAGEIDRDWLDRVVPSRPVRVQHRSGRLWIINSPGLERLCSSSTATTLRQAPPAAELATGRILDADLWLRDRLGGRAPSLRRASTLLASYGITGVTDASARNTWCDYEHFIDIVARDELLQRLIVMGDASLDAAQSTAFVQRGPTKIYLREAALPTVEQLFASIAHSHAADRAVAIHCVTETEVVFASTAFAEVGSRPGDRIEHASIAPPEVIALLADQGLTVVTQPNFIRERGDTYLTDVPARDRAWLYRGRGFIDAGIHLAAGTDAPLGEPNPWLAMQAAVDRRTLGGKMLGEDEALSPEEALSLFSGDPLAPGSGGHRIAPGSTADFCVLDRPWTVAKKNLAATRVIATIRAGHLIWQG
ncbi:hypothetical protein ACG33_00385 [Steroidobacter denitrificans]|uniref:Amidohydrolase 3 domain-containing protein n=1 Tax=Steroidobacter denitrificans TaxID=465721 RepID=A0A127F559_STEDE|nr:amidohydrolase family protein [Steroidobacter denitrificans]AMN45584.1 hypothetical protein ACG33_00385 [Steroidobacter denitrificans]